MITEKEGHYYRRWYNKKDYTIYKVLKVNDIDMYIKVIKNTYYNSNNYHTWAEKIGEWCWKFEELSKDQLLAVLL